MQQLPYFTYINMSNVPFIFFFLSFFSASQL